MKIGFVGDLHLDNKNIGQHKDYYTVCKNVCEDITKFLTNEGITHLICTGDLTNKNINDYTGLQTFIHYFAKWNTMLEGNVYALRGNHDYGATPRFYQLLETAKLIKTNITETYTCGNIVLGNVVIHFMNYGDTDKQLDISSDKVQVLVSHADWEAEGTGWYGGVEAGAKVLADMTNLVGVDYIINGHIHRPTTGLVTEHIKGSPNRVQLFNIGCPTRPTREKDLWSEVYFPIIEIEEGVMTNFTAYQYKLPLEEEVYNLKDVKAEAVEVLSVEELHKILDELQTLQVLDGTTLINQIYALAGVDKKAAEVVIKALESCGMKLQ